MTDRPRIAYGGDYNPERGHDLVADQAVDGALEVAAGAVAVVREEASR